MYTSVKKKKRPEFVPDKSAHGLETLAVIKSDISRSVALDASLKTRDPIWHLTETFATTFNRAGRGLTEQLAGAAGIDGTGFETQRDKSAGNDGTGFEVRGEAERQAPQAEGKWDFTKHYETSPLQKQSGLFLRRFGQTAFDGGSLAAGILQGKSRYMLVSCLKRSIGQSEPVNARQQKLFGGPSVHKNLPREDAQVVFNRGDIKSAVGIVVSSLKSAGRVLDTIARAAESEDSPAVQENIETLRQLYPFLTVESDRKALEKYRGKLKELKEQGAGQEITSILERRIAKLQAIVDKKIEMKTQFMTKLREYSDNAIGAEALFMRAEFVNEVYEELKEHAAGSGEDGDDKGKNRRYSGQAETAETEASKEKTDERAPPG